MKQKILFSIFFLATWQGLVWGQESACAEEGLHPFWAQEYTGADLLREKLQKSTQWEVPDHLFQIWDDSLWSHGEKVSNLIASPYPSAPIPSNKLFYYIPFLDLNIRSEYYNSFMRCQEENSCPVYINISMGFPKFSEQGANVAELIEQTNMVVVVSAGNNGTIMNPIKRKYAIQKDIIAVGNCGTNGNPYHKSNYAPEITVCAPAGRNILRSYYFSGKRTEFGGTSGSTPQITGALVAFTAITGYSLNPQESIEILKKTAIPHPYLPTQSNMGAGMLNTWKIGEVAFKLRKRCQENKTCYADSLQSEDTFKFSVDKASLIKRTSDMEKEGGSREEKENLLKDLRKAALLSSFDGQLWGFLASINRKRCLEKQAQYYQSLANRTEKTDRKLLYELEEARQYSMIKYFSFFHEEIREDLTELYFFLLKLEDIGKEALIDLSQALINNAELTFATQQEVLWEMLINHSKIDGAILKNLGGGIADNAENIPTHEKFLLAIINHSKINEAGLEYITRRIAFNAENISTHERLLLAIINHPKIDWVGIEEVARWVAYDAENIPAHERLLLEIIDHSKIDGEGLEYVARWIIYYAENIPAHERLLLEIINHSKIDGEGLEHVARRITFNAENIPAYEKLLQAIKSRSAFTP